jgi:Domain of unknown function (DUF4148)
MYKFLALLFIVSVAPTLAVAQTSEPLTRAQVRAELVQLEKAGFNPGDNALYYPRNVQAAVASLNERKESESIFTDKLAVSYANNSSKNVKP